MKKLLLLLVVLWFSGELLAQESYYERLNEIVLTKNDTEVFRVFDSLNKELTTEEKHDIAHCMYAEFCQLDDNFNGENYHSYSTYWLKKAAEEGHFCAQVNLGHNYELGVGVPMDYNKAMNWYMKAHKEDTLALAVYLSNKFLEGKICKKDNERGVNLLRVAAKEGGYQAEIMYALCNRYGIGTSQNEKEAMIWFAKSYETENIDSSSNEFYFSFYKNQKRLVQKMTKTRSEILDSGTLKNKYHIWIGRNAVESDIIKAQLAELIRKVNYARGQTLIIRAFGNSSYDAQQMSWEKMEVVRLCIVKHFPNINYTVEYGRNGDRRFVEFELKKGRVKGPTKLPPPFPSGLNHYFDFCGKAYFSP